MQYNLTDKNLETLSEQEMLAMAVQLNEIEPGSGPVSDEAYFAASVPVNAAESAGSESMGLYESLIDWLTYAAEVVLSLM